jgi:adenosylcobinamide-GDP ribazoletransferase
MTRLVIAARFLTIVPLPGPSTPHEGPGAAAGWFPVIGLAIGALLLAVDRVTSASFVPLLASLITVAAWKVITGGLHLDGLADCLDGLAGRDAEHRLAIMHDSRIGAFGTVGLILFLLLMIGSVSGIDPRSRGGALLAAPVIGRAMPPLLAKFFPAAGGGHGARFRAELPMTAAPIALVLTLVVAVAALGARGVVALVLAIIVTVAFGAFMARRLGGITGDVHGAVVELAEAAVLLTAAAGNAAR